MQVVYERCAGLDVHKRSVTASRFRHDVALGQAEGDQEKADGTSVRTAIGAG